MTEIELKARISDLASLEDRVSAFAEYHGQSEKFDDYWCAASNGTLKTLSFRIRKEAGESTVTFKDKHVEAGMEINVEHEFSVSDPEEFRLLLHRIGCVPTYSKHKTSRRYTTGDILIELNSLEGLGDFIEIEKLVAADGAVDIISVREELLEVLKRCGFGEKDLEPRFYSEMLAQKRTSPNVSMA